MLEFSNLNVNLSAEKLEALIGVLVRTVKLLARENGDEVGRIDAGTSTPDYPLSDVVACLADGEELIGFAGETGWNIYELSAVVLKPNSITE